MDYDTTEMAVGAALVLLPIAGLVAAGLWCMKKPQARMPWFFFLGPAAALAYGWFAGQLALTAFPPPFDPAFAGGRGLDLRGMIIVLCAMAGGAAGMVISVVFCCVNLVRSLVQQRRDVRVP
ncbi:hypothetical protein CVV68_06315 [Arthrobacter livingstonensis]|uniref:Uncharacterized protein n=1 Tax=Arthrobacter livingstonensis TaxID=670078 RepID=A0A2V5L9Q1_9MICC|nr:hypothetical protein [Arthrobacter livingstonensis]PYI68421.1 hypothetical protein CVV68_06315 [Arthrobacter livingstonensis]